MNSSMRSNDQNGSQDRASSEYASLIEMDDEEKLVCMIRKHPIGLFVIYATGFFIALLIIVTTSVAGLMLHDHGPSELQGSLIGLILSVIGVLVALFVLFFTYVSGFIYQHNVILVTTDKIAQILYKNLINRKISQLSIGEVQDVTVEQVGFLARIFNYGTLVIETAGEQNNYNFTYTPYPHQCSKDIVYARELSIKKYGN